MKLSIGYHQASLASANIQEITLKKWNNENLPQPFPPPFPPPTHQPTSSLPHLLPPSPPSPSPTLRAFPCQAPHVQVGAAPPAVGVVPIRRLRRGAVAAVAAVAAAAPWCRCAGLPGAVRQQRQRQHFEAQQTRLRGDEEGRRKGDGENRWVRRRRE